MEPHEVHWKKKKRKKTAVITWRAKKTGVWENFIHAISRCQKRLMSVPTSSRSLLKTTIKDQVLFSKQMDIVVFNVGWGKAEVRICSEHSELVEDKKKCDTTMFALYYQNRSQKQWRWNSQRGTQNASFTRQLTAAEISCSKMYWWEVAGSSIDYYFSDILNLMVR